MKQLVYGCCKFIEQKKIDTLISAGIPHCIETWAFTSLLETIYSGRIYIIDYSPIPGFVSIYYGLDKLIPLKLNNKFKTINVTKDNKFRDYIQLQKKDSRAVDSKGRFWLCDLDGYNSWKFYSLGIFLKGFSRKYIKIYL